MAAQRETADFAFDAARVAPMSAGDDSLLQNFVEDGVMERRLAARGESRRRPGVYGG